MKYEKFQIDFLQMKTKILTFDGITFLHKKNPCEFALNKQE